jgi:hypothetical protein
MHDRATPAFHGKLRQPAYYEALTTQIKLHRRSITLRQLAEKLNAKLLTTPTGLFWNRARLANFIRNTGI